MFQRNKKFVEETIDIMSITQRMSGGIYQNAGFRNSVKRVNRRRAEVWPVLDNS